MDYVIVFITAPDEDTAADIARTLIGDGLAACANIIRNVRSIYRWQGKIEDAAEVLMLVKAHRDSFAALEKKVKSMHPYVVPEIVCVELSQCSGEYLHWLEEAAGRPGK